MLRGSGSCGCWQATGQVVGWPPIYCLHQPPCCIQALIDWLSWVGWLQIMCQNVWMTLVAHTPQTVRIMVLASPTPPYPSG